MDCSKTENYFAEKARMCRTINCNECGFCILRGFDEVCKSKHIERTDEKRAIVIVQQWSDEHPRKTILDDFKERNPDAPIGELTGLPFICAKQMGYNVNTSKCDCYIQQSAIVCKERWNTPLESEAE